MGIGLSDLHLSVGMRMVIFMDHQVISVQVKAQNGATLATWMNPTLWMNMDSLKGELL